jgi:hypothetical protein
MRMFEFLGGLATLLVGGTVVATGARHPDRVATPALAVALLLQAGVLGTLAFDWGYSWTSIDAISMGFGRCVWILVPQALAVLVFGALAAWGRDALPWVLVVAAVQAATYEPVLLAVGRSLTQSMLAPAPIAGQFASLLSAFLFVPAACTVIPAPGGRWHRIAFGPRARLIEAIRGLDAIGLAVSPPATVFESGSARGAVADARVRVTTEPSVLPAGYALRVRVEAAGAVVPAALPGLAAAETVRSGSGWVEYVGTSRHDLACEPERLREWVKALAGS